MTANLDIAAEIKQQASLFLTYGDKKSVSLYWPMGFRIIPNITKNDHGIDWVPLKATLSDVLEFAEKVLPNLKEEELDQFLLSLDHLNHSYE